MFGPLSWLAMARSATARRKVVIGLALFLGLLLLLGAVLGEEMARDPHVATVETESGAHRFSVELARTPAERARGLMFRSHLPADAGMLFLYESDQPIQMWMKDTPIPLDMLFLAGDGRIVDIAERAVPHSLAVIASDGPARAVLEVNGGTAARLGIRPGDRVRHPALSGP